MAQIFLGLGFVGLNGQAFTTLGYGSCRIRCRKQEAEGQEPNNPPLQPHFPLGS